MSTDSDTLPANRLWQPVTARWFAVDRGWFMVVENTLARGQFVRQQDYPNGIQDLGGVRAARILRQKVEFDSGPTAMLGINLAGVDDNRVNETETIGLNSIMRSF